MKPGRHYEDFRDQKKIEQGGLIKLSGAFLHEHEAEVLNLVKHEGKLAEEKNADHKVTKIEKANGGFEIETSDHNLAIHIGKQLHHAYKGNHEFKYRKGEKYAEVIWSRD
ncbi:hypothetical protein COT42_04890 [Candidatus Saganbacteria bacterium CG08_land_8_20_14_0_20_45_16]|uniref:Uncharacterized protein n=1 Tax=Candidatus Saganbacteria bacterium CG08_land_8_20_14_0_20_45_16 TaxID=2014293 RepID=A0A2H0XXG4_UNCSA|nr:MAG: hypothetical protein COT42_04890 [Candidatus Saganbacteria bacterium CG08_land_8_20_14_0_20_45_16]